MPRYAFAARLREGTEGAFEDFVAELGGRRSEMAEDLRSAGVHNETIWLQRGDGEPQAIVYFEADDLEAAFAPPTTSIGSYVEERVAELLEHPEEPENLELATFLADGGQAELEPARTLWRRFEERAWEKAADLFHPDFVARWPQTRELIRGGINYLELARRQPEPWEIELKRCVAGQGVVVTEVEVTHSEGVWVVISFFAIDGGRIREATEYWVDRDGEEPPEWHLPFIEERADAR